MRAIIDEHKILIFYIDGMTMSELNQVMLQKKLDEIRLEHRDLDDVIHRFCMTGGMEQMQLQRLKKRKLKLKEMILKIENELIPDIIA